MSIRINGTKTIRVSGFPALRSGLLLFALVVIGARPVPAQDVNLYVSSKAGDRIARKPTARFVPAAESASTDATFNVDDNVTFQRMDGFGASFLEAGLICINSLPPAAQEEVLQALFDLEKGAGFSAMKTVIAATDFMSAGPYYTYDDTPGDVEMKNFSIARDLGTNGLITYIKRARKYGSFWLEAPMDYPPDWMLFDVKTNQDVQPRYYDALSRYYLRYLQEYDKNGVFVDYLSLFNEPGIYTKISYTEIRELLKNHVVPLLRKNGIKSKILLSEAPDRANAYKNYPDLLNDPEARKAVAAMPYHGYEFKDFDKMKDLQQRYPELPLWQTEICYAYDAGTPRTMPLPRYDFQDGDFWGNQIISDIEANTSAWIYWNMVLDEKGGPWLVSEIHGDPQDNVQHSVVVINRKTKKVTYTGLYYYLAHFSKFVRPGSVRIQTQGTHNGIRAVSFKQPDGTLVSELLNSRPKNVNITLKWRNLSSQVTLPAFSITTALWNPQTR
jgi:glucosylceramidase